ncbi:MAG: hypothetical protein AAB209_13600, partial [Bacteroidota bacterium]
RGARSRRRAATVNADSVVERPADEVALERLKALATSNLIHSEDRRPFFFAITERHSGTLLFVGKIVEPKL